MIGEEVTDAQLNEMLVVADLDKDGKINYEGKFVWVNAAWKKVLIFFVQFQSLPDCLPCKRAA